MHRSFAFIIVLFSLNTFATTLDCTTKFSRAKTDGSGAREIWCGPIKMNVADNGAKYSRRTAQCDKIFVDFYSITPSDDYKFVTNCEKIYRRSCYLVRIRDIVRRGGMGALRGTVVFESARDMPDSFNINAHAYSKKLGRAEIGTNFDLDLNCRVIH